MLRQRCIELWRLAASGRNRWPRSLFGAAVFLIAVLGSPASTPFEPDLDGDPPSAAEVRVLDHLATWVAGEIELDEDWATTVQARRESFELFRRHGERGPRRRLVSRLPYGGEIVRVAQRRGVDPLLVASIVAAESHFRPGAVSSVGAMGLMQLMPDTFDRFASGGDPFDPVVSLEVGTSYFRTLLDEFDGDVVLALAGYNAGPGNVQRHDGVPPFAETRRYIGRVLSLYCSYLQQIWEESGGRDWLLLET